MKLEAVGVEKWYFRGKGERNRFFAVHPTDLTLEEGKMTVLTGRSGSGKTTLMHMMAGLLAPSGGRIAADGQDLYALDEAKLPRFRNRHFAVIPQGADLLPDLTVMENLLLPRQIYRASREERSGRAAKPEKELLAQMGIGDLADVPAKQLSGGERRRVCVARALAGAPDVIFADEPTSDLDDANMDIVLQLLRQAADAGACVFIVTHDAEALSYADAALAMHSGRLQVQNL